MANRLKSICRTDGTLQNEYDETKGRLRKIEKVDFNVSIWGCEFKELLLENPGLENEHCWHL